MLAAVILAGGLHAIARHAGAAATSCSASIARPLVFEYDSLSGLGTFSTGIVTLSCKAPEFLGSVTVTSRHDRDGRHELWRDGSSAEGALPYLISARGAQDASSEEFDAGGSSLTIGRSVMRYSVVLSARLLPEAAPPEAGTYLDSVTVTFNL
jgi:hypothetical protein